MAIIANIISEGTAKKNVETDLIQMKGAYCLIVQVSKSSTIKIGSLGIINFDPGYYIYVGSAMNSLESRVHRHLNTAEKKFCKLRWHIDYLLTAPGVKIIRVYEFVSKNKIECTIAYVLSQRYAPVSRFGSSDCKCGGHLFKVK
ncbi:GIY-YIG nuclease family protein [Candidatus Bathyarchaeota archaeon]|nr:GIY-YIG nuclease family protein [Candidatus Bathyarchaeota archaeon]MBS7630416.1 GIY-YIG nuclease family protein [Candidatus Bathyarchaeota archaeon]